LIDELFFSVLGWDKNDFKPEESEDKEFADYTFFNPNRCLIVEAKRTGTYFEMPSGYKKTEYKLSSLIKDSEPISKAIYQALGYCSKRGVEYGAVANGYQIIIFLASRNDGISPIEGKALVYESLEKILENFLEFWQSLSPSAVKERRLSNKLKDNQIILLPPKLSSKITGYPGNKNRNTLQVDLQIVGEVVLEDVVKNEEIESDFVKETYCSSGALSQYALVSKSILETRYALLFDQNYTSDKPLINDAVTKKGVSKEIFAESLSKRPILLIGDVGTGKSMFIKYLRNNAAKEVFDKSYTIYIDLGSKAAFEVDLKKFVQVEIENIFREKYNIDFEERNFVRGVYHGELIRFSKGIHGDLKETDPQEYKKQEIKFLEEKLLVKYNHIKACLENITKSWKKQVVIFIDNVDQRNNEIQEEAFLAANEIAQNWPATIFLTIRPSTFYLSKKLGALTGYHPKAFTIAPPRVDDVIVKRLRFARKISSGEIQSEKLGRDLTIKLNTLTQFIEILEHSFLSNNELKECIDNLCYGNIRLAIEFLTTFIGSGHIDTQKILDLDNQHIHDGHGKRYIVSLHEFLRALTFKDNNYYNPLSSPILNLFDISQSDGREHFIIPIFLDYFDRNVSHANAEGFLETTHIIEFLQNFGFNYLQIEFCLSSCFDKGLIETEGRAPIGIDKPLPLAIRITGKGAYHVKRLIKYFTYVDAMIVDTPILNDTIKELIVNSNEIERRISRCILFCNYLDKEWEKIHVSVKGFNWLDISKAIRADILIVEQRLYRN
jgi:hypothetical protein